MFGRQSRMNLRLAILALVFAACGAALTARVAYIQIAGEEHYKNEARQEHFGQQEIRAPRGAILDRNGFPLAPTVDAWDIFIDRKVWRDEQNALKGAAFIAPIIGRQAADLVSEVREDDEGLHLLYAGLDFDEGTGLHDADAPGLRVVRTTKRFYPEGDLASPLLGFV